VRGRLLRTLQLPEGVQVYRSLLNILNKCWLFGQDDQIKATLKNGLLTVTFPKTLPELAPKKIVIQPESSDKEYQMDF
jgi:HSP20 family protein